ncbi:MAG: acyltransferase family protein [Panacagrimonas sp.]
MSGEQKHLSSLDGYRGFAMWLVIGYHMFSSPGFGWMAMQTFFVLSGFLITRMLLVEEHLPIKEGLKLFYWRRALRIFPALYAYLLIMAVIAWISPEWSSGREMLGWSAIYLQNLAWIQSADAGISSAGMHATQHLWSLCVEEHFYVFWPLLFLLAGKRYRITLIAAFIVLGPVVRWLIQDQWTGERDFAQVIYVFSGSHIDAFAIGALTTLIFHHPSCRNPGGMRFLLLVAAAVAVGILLVQTPLVPRGFTEARMYAFGYPLFMHAAGQGVWGYTVLNLLAAQLILLAVYHPAVSKFLNNRFLVWSGKISYPMYLMHQPVLHEFQKLRLVVEPYVGSAQVAIVLTAVVYLVVIFVIGSLSFRYFESWFMKFKPRHRTGRTSPQEVRADGKSASTDIASGDLPQTSPPTIAPAVRPSHPF